MVFALDHDVDLRWLNVDICEVLNIDFDWMALEGCRHHWEDIICEVQELIGCLVVYWCISGVNQINNCWATIVVGLVIPNKSAHRCRGSRQDRINFKHIRTLGNQILGVAELNDSTCLDDIDYSWVTIRIWVGESYLELLGHRNAGIYLKVRSWNRGHYWIL